MKQPTKRSKHASGFPAQVMLIGMGNKKVICTCPHCVAVHYGLLHNPRVKMLVV